MIDPVDRPEYGSLSAASPAAAASPRRRSVLPWLIAALAVAFTIGLLTNPWFERNVRARLPGAATPASADAQLLTALQARLDALEAARRVPPALNDPAGTAPASTSQMANQIDEVEDAQATVAQRLVDLQSQVTELSARTESSLAAVAEGAERAQTALLVGALRRAVERGQRLDAYEPAVRAQFGRTYPAETAALLALGRAPVTPEGLAQALERTSPTIESAGLDGRGWWDQFKANLAGVVAVRRAGDASPDTAARLRVAARLLNAGDVDAAARSLSTLPPQARRAAGGWLAAARRYTAGMQALAALELAALAPGPVAAPVTPTTL